MNARKSVLVLVAAILVGACGSSPTTATSGGPSKVASIAGEVPSSLAGSPIQIATDATYAPNEFVDPNTGAITGWDIDLGNAICKVTYYKAGEAWLEKPGGPTINTAADMCGHSVAVESGTVEESDAWGYMGQSVGGTAISGDKNNCPAGKDIKVLSFSTQTDANSALLSGRADFGWLDQPVADYQVKQLGGKVKIGGKPCSVAPYGIAMVKGSPLEKAITDAVKYLIDNNGYYSSILKNWNVTDGAVASSDVTLNNNNSIGATCVPSY